MSEELNENLDSQNQEAEEALNTEEVEEVSADETTENLDALQEKNKKLFERAKRAETELKELKAKAKLPEVKSQPAEKQAELSPKDLYALMDAHVPQADVDEVVKAAKILNKSVTDALNDDVVKTLLSQRAEYRKTAGVANTSGSKRTTAKLSDEQLVEKANRGEDVDPVALAEARHNLRLKK